MEFLVNEFLESKDLWMDQLEKALCMADKLIYKTNLIPLSLWKSQNIKCRMKIPWFNAWRKFKEKNKKHKNNKKINGRSAVDSSF